jgi:glutathione S-transferase
MSIVFFSAPMSSASPVESALSELAVPHEKVRFDLSEQKHKQPDFLKLNPNGKVPTLVVDGTPMFEALAIMQWLGDRYGVDKQLWPATDSPKRLGALSWSTWAYVTYGSAVQRLNFAQSPRVSSELHSPAQAKVAQQELQSLLGILDAQLAGKSYLLGTDFGLVDLIVVCVVRYGSLCGASPEGHANVSAWLERCSARPSLRMA